VAEGGPGVRTLEQARAYVAAVRVCTVFAHRQATACLWDAVDLPDKQPGESGWGQRIGHLWRWKNELPERYPGEIYYGKLGGGDAVLMTVGYLTQVHYPRSFRAVSECSHLARRLFDRIRAEPCTTKALRQDAMAVEGCARSAFERALRELQVTLNIVRANHPGVERDLWVPFAEQYPGLGG
jgi:hypothetical protein